MPELRYYTVTQEQEVKVSATNPTDAIALADRVFSGTKHPADQINVQQWPRTITVILKEGQ